MSTPSFMPARQPDQIAYVVENLEESIKHWSLVLGRNDWAIYTYGPDNVQGLTYRGNSAAYGMRLALCGENPQVELIQSIQGPNVYLEQLDVQGPGLHHVGFFVDSIANAVERLAEQGLQPVLTGYGYGLDADGGFAYFELPGIGGFVEFIEVPRRRREPETL